MLSTCNDKSSFAYWKLLLKVCSKHMTVEQKSHLSWGLWTYDFQQSKLNKPHICQRFHHIETNKLIYKVIWSAGFYTKIPWKKKQIKFISVKKSMHYWVLLSIWCWSIFLWAMPVVLYIFLLNIQWLNPFVKIWKPFIYTSGWPVCILINYVGFYVISRKCLSIRI